MQHASEPYLPGDQVWRRSWSQIVDAGFANSGNAAGPRAGGEVRAGTTGTGLIGGICLRLGAARGVTADFRWRYWSSVENTVPYASGRRSFFDLPQLPVAAAELICRQWELRMCRPRDSEPTIAVAIEAQNDMQLSIDLDTENTRVSVWERKRSTKNVVEWANKSIGRCCE
jgi:hypothetical protein